MSYAALGSVVAGFGAVHPKNIECPCWNCAGVKIAHCNGGETAYNCPEDVYCPTSTWSNATYDRIKHRESWRSKNERRVRHVLHQLLAPVGIDSSGMEHYKYNHSAGAVDPGLAERVGRAAYNWHQIYPASRWKIHETCIPTGWQTDGFYNCFRRGNVAASPERVPAIENAMGRRIAEPYRSKLLKEGHAPNFPGAPADLEKWWRANHKVVDRVPGSEGNREANYLPVVIPSDDAPGAVLTVENGRVVAGEWLDGFLDLFAPPQPKAQLIVKAHLAPSVTSLVGAKGLHLKRASLVALKARAVPQEEGSSQGAPINGGTGGGAAKWVLGGLLVAGVGLGVWKWRKS